VEPEESKGTCPEAAKLALGGGGGEGDAEEGQDHAVSTGVQTVGH